MHINLCELARVAFSNTNLDGVIATKDDPNTPENEVEITRGITTTPSV